MGGEMKRLGVYFILSFLSLSASAQSLISSPPSYYRELTLNIRTQSAFKVPMPDGKDMPYEVKLILGEPIYREPIVRDIPLSSKPGKFMRSFWDRIWLKDGSAMQINNEQVPLTCIYISGQDNRYSGDNAPTIPQLLLKVYLVANDYSCQGPIRPGWPESGGKKENWDTYAFYEIRDPTIMLPVESKIRFRWNELTSILVR